MRTDLQRLGDYKLEDCLRYGDIAEVWKAFDPQLQRYIALKIFHADLQNDPDFMACFWSLPLARESQLIVSLRHPNIVQIHGFQISRPSESESPLAYLVMDYIEGPALGDYIRNTSFSAADIIHLFASIGFAIDYAHQKGVIHGDIKPTNILIDKRNTSRHPMGEPMLTDFGLARLLGTSTGILSQRELDTPFYISPEQAQGHPGNMRSDIYSLGVILYEICTGVQPLREEKTQSIKMQHIDPLPTPPTQINPNISPSLSAIILRSLAKDPGERFPSAVSMVTALTEALDISVPETLSQSDSLANTTNGQTNLSPIQSTLPLGLPLSETSSPNFVGLPLSEPTTSESAGQGDPTAALSTSGEEGRSPESQASSRAYESQNSLPIAPGQLPSDTASSSSTTPLTLKSPTPPAPTTSTWQLTRKPVKPGGRNIKMLTIVRALLVLATILLTIFIVQGQQKPAQRAATRPNPIQIENKQPGDASWKITKPSVNGEIQAYAGKDSINIGETVNLHVSTKVPDTYRIDIYRLGEYNGKGGRLMQTISNNPSIAQGYYPLKGPRPPAPINCPTCIVSLKDSKGQETNITDANWKASTTLTFAPKWISGIYEIKLTESQGYQWLVAIVVRDDSRRADLVFQDPLNTDQAYNEWGGTSFYRNFRTYGPTGVPSNAIPPYWAFYLSYNRPNLLGYGAGNLFDWTYPMTRFLEQRGYDVIYTTNNAVAEGLTRLLNYKGFLSAGHDEYVSFAERQKIEQALANGISIGYFGANDMYWQTRSLPDREGHTDRIIVEYKDYDGTFDPYDSPSNPNKSQTTTLWRSSPVNNPEDRLLKAMYPLGAWCECALNFIATNTRSWVYNNTGLKDGDEIPGIIGSEIDSIFLDDGSITPHDHITIIGQSPFKAIDSTRFTANAVLDEFGTNDYITIAGRYPYAFGHHNIIFNAGTIYWPLGLSVFRASSTTPESHALEQMTDNILQKMVTI